MWILKRWNRTVLPSRLTRFSPTRTWSHHLDPTLQSHHPIHYHYSEDNLDPIYTTDKVLRCGKYRNVFASLLCRQGLHLRCLCCWRCHNTQKTTTNDSLMSGQTLLTRLIKSCLVCVLKLPDWFFLVVWNQCTHWLHTLDLNGLLTCVPNYLLPVIS